ncbi:MAG: hypothetical protein M1815_000969 [Lichina confinis]|nr:MAG: hypothetical protein M1815_000969 [Lichina confinis]
MQSIRKVLNRIEDAVPYINLAITTSGANLSTTLPATVSPSRLLQASTFLTAGDTQYSIQPGQSVQIGPTFTLSVYMLFAGHAHRWQDGNENVRETTWKEVIHKARVKLKRTTLEGVYDIPQEPQAQQGYFDRESSRPAEDANHPAGPDLEVPVDMPYLTGDGRADEFAYHLLVIEDFEDDRVHSFEENEPQPGLYDDVALAGIREVIPIHQASKIFYADTGKILNIGSEGEVNNPILLLKRDVNAPPPRRMMERLQDNRSWPQEDSHIYQPEPDSLNDVEQSGIDAQLSRESGTPLLEQPAEEPQGFSDHWRFPLDLDPEWIAFEVYNEEPESDDEDVPSSEQEESERRPPSRRSREPSFDPQLTNALASLHLNPAIAPAVQPTGGSPAASSQQLIRVPSPSRSASAVLNRGGPIRTSLSLLEMLIRLTALQQFQQASHLSIPDELLNFFLSESSTTGAGGDGEERRRKRWEARMKVGFDPYDESPVKRRGEDGMGERQHGADLHDDDDNNNDEQDYHGEWTDDLGYESASWRSPRPSSQPPYRLSSSARGSPSPIPARHHTRDKMERTASSPALPLRSPFRRSLPDRRQSSPLSAPPTRPTRLSPSSHRNSSPSSVPPMQATDRTKKPGPRPPVLKEDRNGDRTTSTLTSANGTSQQRGSPLRQHSAAVEEP